MLTLFTIPKAFEGHIGVIQRNAIKSWTLLHPACEVMLLGDDPGVAQAAEELGVRNIPNVERNEFGTPLLDSAYQLADEAATYPHLCYLNADIILTSSFMRASDAVIKQSDWFLMTAQRWNLDVGAPIDFGPGWEEELLLDVSKNGSLSHSTGIDFWVYSKGLLDGIPPLAVGRIAFESWCLYKARMAKADLIDSTKVVVSVHQNHDFSHYPGGEVAVGRGIEAQRNRELVGGKLYFFTIKDRTHILTKKGLRRARDGWRLWRGLRTAQVLPLSAPLAVKLFVKALNNTLNAGRDCLVLVARGRKG